MRKFNILNIFLPALLCLSASCSDYLDVEPEDKFLEEQAYSTEQGVQNVLNGVYINLAKGGLYGGHLTMGAMDILAQRYNISSQDHYARELSMYDYYESNVRQIFNSVWEQSYINILNLNKFIESQEEMEDIISPDQRQLLLGEAYGLRAMLHFDMLRIFGPVMSVDATLPAIPYYKIPEAEMQPLLSADQAVAEVLNDLSLAAEYLGSDPVITNGVNDFGALPLDEENAYYEYSRNRRFNYWAAIALQARVNLYAGNRPAALQAAQEVIGALEQGTFTWTPFESIVGASYPNRVFSSEIIMGVDNRGLYETHRSYFGSSLQDDEILAPLGNRLEQVFESNENDYRYNSSWKLPANGAKTYKTFFKFEQVLNSNNPTETWWRYLQPLIRVSEMYYIAAEATDDGTLAMNYLNTVRMNRGLADLEPGFDLQSELQKEYQKEFFGEGQLFFYYKRLNIPQIPNGSASSANISMDPDNYVVPLPLSETNYQS